MIHLGPTVFRIRTAYGGSKFWGSEHVVAPQDHMGLDV